MFRQVFPQPNKPYFQLQLDILLHQLLITMVFGDSLWMQQWSTSQRLRNHSRTIGIRLMSKSPVGNHWNKSGCKCNFSINLIFIHQQLIIKLELSHQSSLCNSFTFFFIIPSKIDYSLQVFWWSWPFVRSPVVKMELSMNPIKFIVPIQVTMA